MADGGIGEAVLADAAGIDLVGGATGAGDVLGNMGLYDAMSTPIGLSAYEAGLPGIDAFGSGLSSAQQAYLQASTASAAPGISSGVTPFATTTPGLDASSMLSQAQTQGFDSSLSPTQQAYLQASTASATPGIPSGVTPTPASFANLQSNIDPSLLEKMSVQQVAATAPTPGLTGLPGVDSVLSFAKDHPYISTGMGLGALMARDSKRFGVPGQQPYKGPLSQFVYDPSKYNPASSYLPMYRAAQGGIASLASGGISSLGGYSDGGRMLKGPGDGMSDSIPATIGQRQPARLAEGEFVVPADVVSHLGNGSTDAGAKQLYAMMDRVRQARTGTKKQGREIKPSKYTPA